MDKEGFENKSIDISKITRLKYTIAWNKVSSLLWAHTKGKLETKCGVAPFLSNPVDKQWESIDPSESICKCFSQLVH